MPEGGFKLQVRSISPVRTTATSARCCWSEEVRAPARFSCRINPGELSACPAGGAFLEEGRDAFPGVVREGVHGHYLLGIGVGFLLIQIDLRIERLLAQSHHQVTRFGNTLGELRSEERRVGK